MSISTSWAQDEWLVKWQVHFYWVIGDFLFASFQFDCWWFKKLLLVRLKFIYSALWILILCEEPALAVLWNAAASQLQLVYRVLGLNLLLLNVYLTRSRMLFVVQSSRRKRTHCSSFEKSRNRCSLHFALNELSSQLWACLNRSAHSESDSSALKKAWNCTCSFLRLEIAELNNQLEEIC